MSGVAEDHAHVGWHNNSGPARNVIPNPALAGTVGRQHLCSKLDRHTHLHHRVCPAVVRSLAQSASGSDSLVEHIHGADTNHSSSLSTLGSASLSGITFSAAARP